MKFVELMKVLVIGSGGREHTIIWKLSQSPKVDKIYAAPGNGGISELAECVSISVMDFEALTNFAKESARTTLFPMIICPI